MLSAATFGTAQISFDPGDGCLNVIDVSYAQGIGEYGDEHRVNGKWETLSIKPRKDGAVYAFPSIGYELAAHASRHFTIHIRPDMYDFEQGRAYRIGKEYTVSGEKGQALPIAISQQTKVHNENKWIFPSHHRATVTDYKSYLRQTVRMDA